MASRNDVSDILGLSRDAVPKPSPALKRAKATKEKRPTGISREVLSLTGDRAPPVAVIDHQKAYKGKLKRQQRPTKAAKWEVVSFINSARTDDLVLRHWRRVRQAMPADEPEDTHMASAEEEQEEKKVSTDYAFAKYNVQIDGPTYTDQEYEDHLRDDDWSKEETDYLVDMVKEFYQRWPIIADRYSFQPLLKSEDNDTANMTPPKERTLEELKARYYRVSAKVMELRTPGGIANMNPAEFNLHEILTKYDPEHEAKRKRLAEGLLARDYDQVKEEEQLLAELQRISIQQARLEAERAEIRARLEAPQSSGPSQQYQSSQALNQLFQQLFQADRNRKRGRLSLPSGDVLSSPATGTQGGTTPTTAGTAHRDSIGGSGAQHGAQRKASAGGLSGATSAAAANAAPVRSISPRQEPRFGITSHDRLSSGLTFRSDRITKLRQAKSSVQTQKMAAALAALRVPDLIVLPTAKVCEVFEGLVGKVSALVDVRKVIEKTEGEVKIAEAMRRQRLGEPEPPGEEPAEGAPPQTDHEQKGDSTAEGQPEDSSVVADGDGDGDGDGQKHEASGSRPPSRAAAAAMGAGGGGGAHKRSASVLSAASSNKSTKRVRR